MRATQRYAGEGCVALGNKSFIPNFFHHEFDKTRSRTIFKNPNLSQARAKHH